MLIWAGKGMWALVIPFFFWAIGGAVLGEPTGTVVGALLGGGLIWYFGSRFNEEDDNQHTLFFIPMQWAGPLIGIIFAVGA
ncbi:hypothetical protein Y695_02570 [Hydrogenophaga sp. T4]|nr:hypothetical protein Y695_02570 [Hydrogenophaga sp. T4]